jgi:hypothetical protein
MRGENLDGYVTAEVLIVGAVHLPHPSRTDALNNAVMAQSLPDHAGLPLINNRGTTISFSVLSESCAAEPDDGTSGRKKII